MSDPRTTGPGSEPGPERGTRSTVGVYDAPERRPGLSPALLIALVVIVALIVALVIWLL